MSCAQVSVSGSSGIIAPSTVSFPGAYKGGFYASILDELRLTFFLKQLTLVSLRRFSASLVTLLRVRDLISMLNILTKTIPQVLPSLLARYVIRIPNVACDTSLKFECVML